MPATYHYVVPEPTEEMTEVQFLRLIAWIAALTAEPRGTALRILRHSLLRPFFVTGYRSSHGNRVPHAAGSPVVASFVRNRSVSSGTHTGICRCHDETIGIRCRAPILRPPRLFQGSYSPPALGPPHRQPYLAPSRCEGIRRYRADLFSIPQRHLCVVGTTAGGEVVEVQ